MLPNEIEDVRKLGERWKLSDDQISSVVNVINRARNRHLGRTIKIKTGKNSTITGEIERIDLGGFRNGTLKWGGGTLYSSIIVLFKLTLNGGRVHTVDKIKTT